MRVRKNAERAVIGVGVAEVAVLLLRANKVVSTDQLVDALWEDDPREGAPLASTAAACRPDADHRRRRLARQRSRPTPRRPLSQPRARRRRARPRERRA